MDELLFYLIRAAIVTSALYGCYMLFYARDTFYRRNRFLLIMIIILPLVLPLIKISYSPLAVTESVYAKAINGIAETGTGADSLIKGGIGDFSLINFLVKLYSVVSVFFLIRMIISFFRMLQIIKGGKQETTGMPYIILTEKDQPAFSFYPFIVIPGKIYKSGEYDDVLTHESAHITQFHSFDILLCELALVLQWFNPIIWLMRREIRLNHEYLADSATLQITGNKKEYQYKLLNIPVSLSQIPLVHSFSNSIKNRLVMINRKPTSHIAGLKNLIFLPVLAFLLISLSFRNETVYTETSGSQFTEKSKGEILKFIATNVIFPQASKAAYDTSTVFVSVKIGKGGTVTECKSVSDRKKISNEILPEIVVVGYTPRPADLQAASGTRYNHSTLVDQCLKQAGRLGEVAIPEFKEKETEFTLVFKFTLK